MTYKFLFSTYIGGSGNDIPNVIVIDDSGNSYVSGVGSSDFPTKNAYLLNGSDKMLFTFKLNPNDNSRPILDNPPDIRYFASPGM